MQVFFKSLFVLTSPSREVSILVRVVAKYIRTITATNMRIVEQETGGVGSTWWKDQRSTGYKRTYCAKS